MGILQFKDIHHALKGKLIEVEAVAHIIVGRYGLGVVVDHHAAIALAADGVKSLHSAPVELHTGADAVGTRAKHYNALPIAQIVYVVLLPTVSQVEVVGLSRIFSSQGVNLLDDRQDTLLLTMAAHQQSALFQITLIADGASHLEISESLHLSPTKQRAG